MSTKQVKLFSGFILYIAVKNDRILHRFVTSLFKGAYMRYSVLSLFFLTALICPLINVCEVMKKDSKIFVAGHQGLVGSAIVRLLQTEGYTNIITRSKDELDLTNQQQTLDFFAAERPEFIFLSAAKVGGIMANNTYPADFIYINLAIECNVIEAAHRYSATKLLFLGSSCIYPRMCPQPICEEYLLTSPLEPTNEQYAIAKIAGIKMCQAYNRQYPNGTKFISCMPTNLYGINDNFHPQNSHVLPALIRRIHEAKINNTKEVVIWGTGAPYREFLYVDDLADACLFLMQHYNDDQVINVGTGTDVTIKSLVNLIAHIVGYQGNIVWDTSKPDGTPRKLLNVDKLTKLGWRAHTVFEDGIAKTYEWYQNQHQITER
jgi:GDP-L-fucose synthase